MTQKSIILGLKLHRFQHRSNVLSYKQSYFGHLPWYSESPLSSICTMATFRNDSAGMQNTHCESEYSMTVKDRLSRLEEELDQLLKLQDSIKTQPLEKGCTSPAVAATGHGWQECGCPCTHPRPPEPSTAKPLTDITKFLQHINFNLSRGTQAITKIAHTSYQKKTDYIPDQMFIGMKELSDEKEKRLRAENQVRFLKEDLKKIRSEMQQQANNDVINLQAELKETQENLEKSKIQLDKIRQEWKAAEYLWPLKYETIHKELQEERVKRNESERNVSQLQKMLQRQYFDTEDHLTLQKSVHWLREQNSNLSFLIKRLESESLVSREEVSNKNKIIDENVARIKQLSILCEKLRDIVQALREKCTSGEKKLNDSLQHCQRLSDRLLDSQLKSERLANCQTQNEQKLSNLTEQLKNTTDSNEALESRITEQSELLQEQTKLIKKQSETISSREVQLSIAFDNIKLQRQRLEEIENKNMSAPDDLKIKQLMDQDFRQIMIQLESEKEKVAIKDKIIESNHQTIGQMKTTLLEKDSEVNSLKMKLSEADKKLSVEQTKSEQLLSKVKGLQAKKEELKGKIEALEDEIDTQLSSEHTKKLERLEEQIREKHKAWEEQKKMLESEKEEALKAMQLMSQQLKSKISESEQQEKEHQQAVQDLQDQIMEETDKGARLTRELEQANDRAAALKKRYDDRLRVVCDTWHKAIQGLESLETTEN